MQEFFSKLCTLPVEGDGSEVFKLFWTLFLVAKASLLEPFPDLVTSFNILVNVLNLLLGHLAPEDLAFSPSDLEHMPERTTSGAADVLRSLVTTSRATPELVRAPSPGHFPGVLMESFASAVLQIMTVYPSGLGSQEGCRIHCCGFHLPDVRPHCG
jgi:hypothetical protein